MKAIRVHEFGTPEVMRVEDVPDPQPGPRQVLVRIHAVGVNPVETYVRSGRYAARPALPYTPGTDAAGVVEAVGSDVREYACGDRVYIGGTAAGRVGAYAEIAVCEVAQVHALPDGVSFAQGAAVNVPYATAYRSIVQLACAKAGETVLVHGASGGVGVAAVQIARAFGLSVIGTAGTDRGLQLVLEQGARRALNHRQPGYLDDIKALTGERGVDIVLEMLANVNLANDLSLLALRGRVVIIGSRGSVEIDPRLAMRREASVIGMVLFNATPDETACIHAGLVSGLGNGTLKPVVGRELPLADAPCAHHLVMEPGAYGKIVLIPGK